MDQIRKWRRRVVFKQSNLSEKNCPRRDDNGILPKQYNIGRIFNAREDIDKNTKVNGANPTFDFEWSGLKAPAEPSRAELPTRRVKFLLSKTSSEEINHKFFLYKIIT